MKDELLDYLIAIDSMDEFLGYEPKCPECGNKMIEIVYGMPGPDTIEKYEKGMIHLGGCMVEDVNPKYHCSTCKRNYYENLVDYIEEHDWLNDN